jgi:trimeric autotransporter adhesin
MKKLTLIIAAFAMLCIAATPQNCGAQTPQAIKYQAIARNSSGDVIANQNVSFRISILQGSASGSTIYEEIQPATTNQFGLANLSIGEGNVVSGIFDSIKWGNDTYFVKIEFDPAGGNNFALMGTSQLLSVPYSLYSAHAKVADNIPVFPIKAALQATNLQAPFDEPETGMLVYNTDSAGSGNFSVIPGYYYNAGTAEAPNWVLLSTEDNASLSGGAKRPCTSNNFAGCSSPVAPTGADNTGFGGNALNALTSASSNTAFGYNALTSVTTGYYNVAIGDGALPNITNNATSNTAIGHYAMNTLNNGGDNTAVGQGALTALFGGNFNTAIGFDALFVSTGGANSALGSAALSSNTTGTQNTVVGENASVSSTTGSNNEVIGYQALYTNITGSSNTAEGANSLYNNTADANTAVGDSALATNSSGYQNVAVGYQAAAANTTATSVTAVGYQALLNSTGVNNTAIGHKSLQYTTTGYDNTAVGYYSLGGNTTGYYNTAVGLNALQSNTTGTYNTTIGFDADVSSDNLTNATAIGYGATAPASNMIILGNTSITYVTIGAGAFAVPVQESTATTGTVTANGSQILNLTGAATSLTIDAPSSPVNGQLWEVTTNQTSITITWSGSFVSAPGTVTKTAPARFFYDYSLSKWVNQ